MSKERGSDPHRPRGALSRRDFLRYSGAGATILAACGPGGLPSDELAAIDLSGLTLDSTKWVFRKEDMLVLAFGFVNLRLNNDPFPKLVRINAGPAFIALWLPSQHLIERTFVAGDAVPAAGAPIAALIAKSSRLVFAVPSDITHIGPDLPALLRVCRQSGLLVNRNAVGWQASASAPGVVSGAAVPGAPRALDPLETAIELPTRLQLSPNEFGRFNHALNPVKSGIRTELWHTRLGTSRRAGGAIVEQTTPERTVRALYNRDRDGAGTPLTLGALTSAERDLIVGDSADYSGMSAPRVPPAIQVNQLALSALGGTLDVAFEAVGGSAAFEGWYHKTSLGRDTSVRVVKAGFAYPYGHRVSLVQISERAFATTGSRPPALLYKKTILVVREPERSYPLEGIPAAMRPLARAMPFASVRFLTLETPPLDGNPSGSSAGLVPKVGGKEFYFDVEAVDRQGRKLRLSVPIAWLPDPVSQPEAVGSVASKLRHLLLITAGQRIAVAPPLTADDTSYECLGLFVSGTAWPTTAPAHTLPYYPTMDRAYLNVEALRAVSGETAPRAFRYHATYLQNGFPSGSGNRQQIFLELEPGQIVRPITVDFGKQADRGGGFVTPSLSYDRLSRLTGPVSESLTNLEATTVDGATVFKEIAGGLPKLFGCIELGQILGSASPERLLPRFVAEAFTLAERLNGEGRRLIPLADQLKTLAGQVASPALSQLVAKVDLVRGQALESLAAPSLGDLSLEELEVLVAERLSALHLADLGPALRDAATQRLMATVPKVEVPLRQLERLVRALEEILPAGPAALGAAEELLKRENLRATFVALARGLEMARDGRVRLEWAPPIKAYGPFRPGKAPAEGRLLLSGDLRTRAVGNAKAGMDLLCSLENFSIDLTVIALDFKKVQFRQHLGKKPEIDAVFGGIRFGGCLAFVEKLKDIIPLDGFSDPPHVDVSAAGLRAGFDLALPDVAVGLFALQHMAVSCELNVPFLGDALSFRFGFCSRENPFVVQVAWYAGGGFFSVHLTPNGLTALEAAIEFGARLSVSLGVASGCIEVMGGLYFALLIETDAQNKQTPTTILNGYLRMRGAVDVMGLVSASLELRMELEYESAGNKCIGRATVSFHVSLGFFHKTFRATCERQFAGGGGGGASARSSLVRSAAAVAPGERAFTLSQIFGPKPALSAPAHPWLDYWEAFAA